ncbi:hypothetical protein FNV43_RR20924 [Rhamnella rubrinervis]|uniref:DYW domain-containing protein n=1 Tax=Rhamnella rubrinervis TaxID=2594499 RepID=A0A8K0E194_9ROSA|nr:hypothetical protein FNV43_RR20924 [Rhamnella rubrinervis]
MLWWARRFRDQQAHKALISFLYKQFTTQLAIGVHQSSAHQASSLFPLLEACHRSKSIYEAKKIHQYLLTNNTHIEERWQLFEKLAQVYIACDLVGLARRVFDEIPKPSVILWNLMIRAYAWNGPFQEAIDLYHGMLNAGVRPTKFTFPFVLKACSGLQDVEVGQEIHEQKGTCPNSSTIVAVLPTVAQANALSQGKAIHGYSVRRNFCNDVVLGTGLLDMYAKCQCISYARRIFDILDVRNEICWSAMIGAYVMCDSMRDALALFVEMVCKSGMKPTPVTLGSILRASAKLNDLSIGRQVHCYAIKSGFELDTMVGNTLLSMYAKCGNIDNAARFFAKMMSKDTVSYSAIISGCVQNGYAEEGLLKFHQMQLSGIEPDVPTMVSVLPACSHLAARQHGACAHGYSIVHGFAIDSLISNALIDMYSKCGNLNFARKVFDMMYVRDIISWNAMIVGYGIHGLGVEALSLFNYMNAAGIKPDDVTFIGLLSACSHSGLVTEGKHWFYAMSQNFNIIPRMEHYICMADLLGRAGLLDEAHIFIQRMPFEADVRVWGSLLAACRIHNNIELGEEVSKKIQGLGPEGTGNFVLLSNIYSAVGKWDDAANVRIMQKNQGFKKSPGCSWVEVNGVIHGFVGGDQSHPQSTQIHEKLEELLVGMKRLGYHAESGFVLQDVEEEEKERILLYHSEKLAIAFGILSLSPRKPILVTKNLRVCGDCHAAIKLISLVTKRRITVRDTSRFHHFTDGICNCGDFW